MCVYVCICIYTHIVDMHVTLRRGGCDWRSEFGEEGRVMMMMIERMYVLYGCVYVYTYAYRGHAFDVREEEALSGEANLESKVGRG